MVKNSQRTSKKADKEPGPKKPLSAFFYYAQDRRMILRQEQPSLKITEISKLIGQEWNKLCDQDKEKYIKLALDDKSRYENEKIEMLKESKKNKNKNKPIIIESDEEADEF